MANLPLDSGDLGADGHRLLTVLDVAGFLAISRGAVYNLLDDGLLRSVRIGRSRRVTLAEVRRLVDDLGGSD